MIKSHHIVFITIAGILSVLYCAIIGVGWQLWLAALFTYFCMGCLGITVTFHRKLTHNSYQFKWKWMERLFAVFGSIAGTGSAAGWVALHRMHHLHSDTPQDVHGPVKGWGNFYSEYDQDIKYVTVRDILSDPFYNWMHREGLWVILAYYVILFGLGGPVALAIFGFIPQMMVGVISSLNNYFSHLAGYKTYETGDNSYNNWWLAIPTWGESWHNNHHAKPWLYSFKHKWWEFDISAIVIELVRKKP
tara:strand:- start:2194 stop:2934 length:741 start_codon:yes stop_codon:yes gene_type:complete